jgi:predicted nucleotidyltransferase
MPHLDPQQLDAKLDEIVRRLRAAFSSAAIYLFGSYAYGAPNGHSDIDLLVVLEDSPLHAHARDALAYQAIGPIGVSRDVQVYTRREFEEQAAPTVSFERTVKQRGKLLYAA